MEECEENNHERKKIIKAEKEKEIRGKARGRENKKQAKHKIKQE